MMRKTSGGRHTMNPLKLRLDRRLSALVSAIVAALLLASVPQSTTALAQQNAKRRVIVLTDIGPEGPADLDDVQSMIRFVLYSNEVDIEALIATRIGDATVHKDYIQNIVNAYGQIRSNLLLHKSGYPASSYLLSVIKGGHPQAEMGNMGPSGDSEGSNAIIAVVNKSDARPVYIVIWGGSYDLAQALWRVRNDLGAAGANQFASKIRVNCDADQYSATGPWIRQNFPKLFWIHDGPTARDNWTWQENLLRTPLRGFYLGGDTSLVSVNWIDTNLKGHGPLGDMYPTFAGGVNGVKDAHPFLSLLPLGHQDFEKPTWGGWGGRFGEAGPQYFSTAQDTVAGETSGRATVSRWRPGFQNDFAARMDWCVKPYNQANHHPVAVVNGSLTRTVSSGQTVTLDASGSSDPDGNGLVYSWWLYREPSSYAGSLTIQNSASKVAPFEAPNVASSQTLHMILEVKDTGTPSLYAYQRVVVTVVPGGMPPPAAPTGVTATATASSQINLLWTDASGNETGFKIERAAASAGPWTQIATVGVNVTTYSNTGLPASTTYHYRVRATNTAGDSANSKVASATTHPVKSQKSASIEPAVTIPKLEFASSH